MYRNWFCRIATVDRIGYSGKYDRDILVLGRRLHDLRGRRRNRDDNIDFIGNQLGCDLLQNGAVSLTVVIIVVIIEGYAEFLALGIEFALGILHDLVEGRVIDILYDADLISLAGCAARALCLRRGFRISR